MNSIKKSSAIATILRHVDLALAVKLNRWIVFRVVGKQAKCLAALEAEAAVTSRYRSLDSLESAESATKQQDQRLSQHIISTSFFRPV